MVAASEADALHNNPTVIASTDGSGASHTFTLSLDYGRGTLTGTETLFETDLLLVNDIVRVGTQEMIVIAVASETVATVINANPGTTLTTFSGQTYRAHGKPTFVASVGSTDFESTQVFGVRSTEIHGDQTGGYVSAVALIQGGAAYVEVPGVSFSGGGGSSAAATATISGGVVTAIAVTNNGSSYETAPTVTVAGPVLTLPTSTVSPTFDYIQYTAHGQAQGAALKYQDGGGTAASGLTDNTTYYVSTIGLSANALRLASSSVLSAGTTLGTVAISGTGGQFTCANATLATGDRVQITGTLGGTGSITGYTTGTVYKVSAVTGTSPSVTGFTLTDEEGGAIVTTAGTPTGLTYKAGTLVNISGTGNNAQYLEIVAGTTATANAALGVNQGDEEGLSGAVAHTGWVKRKVLTGAHAGRIQYEVLCALSKNGITSDAGDDIEFPED
jgi:hypothetical protein